ncbi:GNAT family N-acetyltransferase [Pseudocolwellia sp. HL-MZ19]|uniref:GNAT family N-acetyltransferase n=1 Tax=unclassified Pseudocolwellia TaxID=2848178 RepID=UPI003CED2A1A
MQPDLTWSTKPFSKLSTDELFDILKLRVDVFVVEQACYYPELDEHDRHPETLHFFAYINEKDNEAQPSNPIAAYLRILPKGTSYDNYISMGRVVVSPAYRGYKLGHLLLKKALEVCKTNFPGQSIKISAQEHLEAYYQQYGFVTVSDMYLEDNIPHISMLYKVEQ